MHVCLFGTIGRHTKQMLAVLDINDAESSGETDLENLFTFSGRPWNCSFSKKVMQL